MAIIGLALGALGCTGPGASSQPESSAPSPSASAESSPEASNPAPSSPVVSADPSPAASHVAPPADGPSAAQVDGRFKLRFTVARTTWRSDESIEGTAVLSLVEGEPIELGVPANGPIEFAFHEVGGRREMGPAYDTACASAELDVDRPIVSAIRKSGGYGEDQPGAEFYRAFFADPLVRLPAGDWDISAVAEFIDDRDCSIGTHHSIRATIRVTITP